MDNTLRLAASRTINQFGSWVTLRQVIDGVFQTAADTVANTEIDHLVKGVVTSYQKGTADGRIRTGDRKVVVAARDMPAQPDGTWKFVQTGVAYDIVMVDPTMGADLPICYTLAVRGAP